MNKKVSAPGSMYPTQTDQSVWMILIGHWEVGQHRAGKQDHQVTIRQEQLLVSPKMSQQLCWKCKNAIKWLLVVVVIHLFDDKNGMMSEPHSNYCWHHL